MPLRADAQFWKKMFHKHKHAAKIDSTANKAAIAIKKKRPDPEYPATVFKQRYRIDYIAPFKLDDIINEDKSIDDKMLNRAQAFVDYYKGIKLAADSLGNTNLEIDINVHDIQDSVTGVFDLIKGNDLEHSDLLLVALPAKEVQQLAEFGKNHHINVVSVYSPSDGGIVNNPYFTMIQPTLSTHCHKMKEALQKQYGKKKILFLYRDNQPLDKTGHELFADNDNALNLQLISCDNFPQKEAIAPYIDTAQKNIVLMPFMDLIYTEKMLKWLHESFPKVTFEVWGMPTWKAINSIHKKDAYPKIDIVFSQAFYFERNTKICKLLEQQYKKEFGGKPSEWVFRGYDNLFFFAGLLKKYGSIFNTGLRDNTSAVFTKYQMGFKRIHTQDPIAYNENQHVYLCRFKNGTMSLIP